MVLDANGQSLVYVYARETKAEADIAKVLTFDEARRIAVNVAKLPGLLGAYTEGIGTGNFSELVGNLTRISGNEVANIALSDAMVLP